MNKCIVTKLSSTINNSNLEVLNALTLEFEENGSNKPTIAQIAGDGEENIIVTVIGEGYIDSTSEKTKVITGTNNEAVIFTEDTRKVSISPRWRLKNLKFSSTSKLVSMPTSIVNRFNEDIDLDTYFFRALNGDMNPLIHVKKAVNKTMSNIDFNTYRGLTGDMYTMGLLGFNTIIINSGNKNLTGDIVDYVKGRRYEGVNEGTTTMTQLNYSGITFNGEEIELKVGVILSWTSNTITYDSKQITA